MKNIFIVMGVVGSVVLFRLNLPPNNVSSYVELKHNTSVIQEIGNKIAFSHIIADWTFTDFIIVKLACSERLKIQLIAIPFNKWKLNRKDIKSCDF